MAIAYEKFIHPEDRVALEKLKAIPLLDTVIGQYGKYFAGDVLRAVNLASKMRVGPRQMSHLYALLVDVCSTLQIDVPDFYIEENPERVSYVCGTDSPFVVLDSETIDLLTPDELKVLVAHECGHILCQHGRYYMLADAVLGMKGGVPSVAGSIIVTDAMKWALAYWLRRSEFSADRVAAFVMNDANVVARTMMRLSFGWAGFTADVNMDEFLHQAEEYAEITNGMGTKSILENWMVRDLTRPYPAVRAAEVVKWFRQTGAIGDLSSEVNEIVDRDEREETGLSKAKTAFGKLGEGFKCVRKKFPKLMQIERSQASKSED